MQKTPLVNIIIITYNEFQYTEKCIDSLLSDGYKNKRIIVVDNASKVSDFEKFREKMRGIDCVQFIRSRKNLGFGGGCNLGLKEIREGYVVFLNNDTEVEHGWLHLLVSYMESNSDVGACQPKIKDLLNRDHFEYAGGAGGFMDVYGYPFARGRVFYSVEKDSGQYDDIVDVVWCSGTAMMVRKEALDHIGGFDELFFMYVEENDLCWRMHRGGWRLSVVPSAVVYHKGMVTMEKNGNSKKVFYLHRNGLMMLLKNYSLSEMMRFFPVRVFLDFIAFGYYLITYPKNSMDIVKAHLDFFALVPRTIFRRAHERSLINMKRKSLFKYPIFRKSVVISYFLYGKQRFSDIL